MRSLVALTLATALSFAATEALAQGAPDKVHAKEAYDRGVAAHERGDFPRAAREFAAADSLAPSTVALQAALEAAVDADDPAIGGELLERSKRVAAPVNPKLARSIEAARKKLGGRAGRVRVTCPAGSTCSATLDGAAFDTRSPTWAATGPHTVVVQLDGETQSKGVDVKAEELVDFAPRKASPLQPPPVAPPVAPPAAPPPSTPPEPKPQASPPQPSPPPLETASPSAGLPPLVFFVGVGATVIAGAGAGYFMVTTKSKHDDFVSAGCEAGPAAGCDSLKSSGSSAQTTANVVLGVTAVLAVATVVIGAAFTNWHGDPKKSALRLNGPGAGGHPSGATYLLQF